jgi:hypothetical protein
MPAVVNPGGNRESMLKHTAFRIPIFSSRFQNFHTIDGKYVSSNPLYFHHGLLGLGSFFPGVIAFFRSRSEFRADHFYFDLSILTVTLIVV